MHVFAPNTYIIRWFALLPCVLMTGCSKAPGPSGTPPSGIVLFTLDTARGDCFDWSDLDSLPNIKALFADGARFDQAISSSPVTGPAHASLFTGLAPTEHGVLSNPLPLSSDAVTLAERLQQIGYRTGGFVSCSVLGDGRGFEQGFEHYDANFETAYAEAHYERDADRTTTQAIEWLESADDRPFFMWLHYFDAHAPYSPPAAFRPEGFAEFEADPAYTPTIPRLQELYQAETPTPKRQIEYYRALYRGQLEFVDQEIGRLRRYFDEHFPNVEMTYVLTADHGEELADHMNFFEHSLSLYDGVLRVPFAISGPNIESERVSEQVDPAGLVATLLELTGQPIPGDISPSLLGAAGRGQARVSAKEIHPAVRPWAVVLRSPPWKYFYWEDGREELYNIALDPAELHDLSGEDEAQLKIMRERAEEEVLPQFSTPEIERALQDTTDPELTEMLRALGYF